MNIAIIGSGIAGLTAGYQLSKSGHQVTLYEQADKLGVYQHSIQVPVAQSNKWIDVPIRSMQSGYYQELSELLKDCNIPTQKVGYAHKLDYKIPSVSFCDNENSTYFKYYKKNIFNLNLPIPSFNTDTKKNIIKSSFDFIRFIFHTKNFNYANKQQPFSEWLAEQKFNDNFLENYLYPSLSMILTCGYDVIRKIPNKILLDYFNKAFSTKHYLVSGGIINLAKALAAPVNEIKLNEKIKKISAISTGVTVHGSENKNYDAVVFAVEGNKVSELVHESNPELKNIFDNFLYEDQRIILHKSQVLMPLEKENWAELNIFKAKEAMSSATLWTNKLLNFDIGYDIFQTWNPLLDIPHKNIISEYSVPRAMITTQSIRARNDLKRYQGKSNLWFCGAYASSGMMLLENAVSSAKDICRMINQYSNKSASLLQLL